MSTPTPEVKANADVLKNPFIKHAVDDEVLFREIRVEQLGAFLSAIKKAKADGELEFDKVRAAVKDRLTETLGLAQEFNAALKEYSDDLSARKKNKGDTQKEDEPPIPCTSNKMIEIVTGTLKLLFPDEPSESADKKAKVEVPNSRLATRLSAFERIFDGELPEDYSLRSIGTDLPVLQDNQAKTVFGTSKATFLTTAVVLTYLVCQDQLHKDKSRTAQYRFSDLANRPVMLYGTTIPKGHDARKDSKTSSFVQKLLAKNPNFERFLFLEQGEGSAPDQLCLPHNRYGFGAGRLKTEIGSGHDSDTGNVYDCSSYLKLFGFPVLSTRDQYYYHLAHFGLVNDKSAELKAEHEKWRSRDLWAQLKATCTPIDGRDPQRIPVGAVYTQCAFANAGEAKKGIPGGGHTGFFTAFKSDGAQSGYEVLSLARDMPGMEGILVKTFPAGDPKKGILFFSPTAEMLEANGTLKGGRMGTAKPALGKAVTQLKF